MHLHSQVACVFFVPTCFCLKLGQIVFVSLYKQKLLQTVLKTVIDSLVLFKNSYRHFSRNWIMFTFETTMNTHSQVYCNMSESGQQDHPSFVLYDKQFLGKISFVYVLLLLFIFIFLLQFNQTLQVYIIHVILKKKKQLTVSSGF